MITIKDIRVLKAKLNLIREKFNSVNRFDDMDTIDQALSFLEEVKENKEPQFYVWDIDIATGKPFKSGSTVQTYSTVKDTSILEKLKEELEKRIEYYKMAELSAYRDEAENILKLLTSLETKEIENPTEESAELQIIKWFDSLKTPQPQFTPWQEEAMIDMSPNDFVKACGE